MSPLIKEKRSFASYQNQLHIIAVFYAATGAYIFAKVCHGSSVNAGPTVRRVMLQELEIKNRRLSVNKSTDIIDWIDYVNPSVTYDEYFSKYLMENKPCIFTSEITDKWSCKRQWNLDGTPDFDVLDISFGK